MDFFLDLSLTLLLVLFLVFLNGFFVAAEFAIVKIRETQLAPLINRGHRRAKIAQRIVRNLDASLSATQLGITLASLGLGWFAEPLFAKLMEPLMRGLSAQLQHSIAFAVGFSVITFLHIVMGELAPKSLAIQKPLPTTLWIASPLLWFYKVSYPFIWALNNTSLWLLRRVGIEPVSEAELVHSEEELRLLFAASQEQAGGSDLGRDIVLNALSLRRRIARDVMRPRLEIVGLDTEASIVECLDAAEKTRYSRFPLCEEGNPDKTLGVVHFKDLFAMRLKAKRGADLSSVARKLIYIPETAKLEKLLQLFLERRLHMAIVVDEYGGTVGMVTLENILEELVGQIQDEFDQEKPLLQKTSDNSWELDGALPLHELSELAGENLEEEGITTTSGFVTHRQGGFAKAGDVLKIGAFELRVEAMDGLRVSRLHLTRRKDTDVSSPPTSI
ncbi:MAG: HlyC/CorC family transporter [Verrucomicrobia bacterium]|nr:HlyC/CorC family transporter [Verrucomicrobiota bacterium]